MSSMFMSLEDDDLFEYFEHFSKSGNLQYVYWTTIVNTISQKSFVRQYQAYRDAMKVVLAQEVKEDEVQAAIAVKQYLLNMIEPIVEECGEFENAIKFLAEVAKMRWLRSFNSRCHMAAGDG